MLSSIEVRWFFRSRLPESVMAWSQQGGLKPEAQNPRVDYYVRLEDIDSLSIKLREGRLEIKQRHTDHGVIRFNERTAGRVESWHKWSFMMADSGRILNEVVSSPATWVAVKKERVLRKYAVLNQSEVRSIPVGQFADRSCQVELSNITKESDAWWSICFEAIGERFGVQDTLEPVIRAVLVGDTPLTLPAEDSFSYPYWLGHFAIP